MTIQLGVKHARKKEDPSVRPLAKNGVGTTSGYIPTITIMQLKSVRLLGSIMLYLMGSGASRVWHDIRGRVNIYPVRFKKCPDLQWLLCCPPAYLLSHPCDSLSRYFCLTPRVTLRSHCSRPASKDPVYRVCRMNGFKEGLTIKRRPDRIKSNGLWEVKPRYLPRLKKVIIGRVIRNISFNRPRDDEM